MRILDKNEDRAVETLTIYLTPSEAAEMRDTLETLIVDSTKHHEHVMGDDSREITICIYDLTMLEQFDDRSKRLITQGI